MIWEGCENILLTEKSSEKKEKEEIIKKVLIDKTLFFTKLWYQSNQKM